ncbi:MAG: DUF2924 domain-containing protein [Candidatus Omnitrophica bacterium]|nr:DUF2924 domain-containing protein [Candidatus Omnitrophota bacterium]
MAVKEKLQSEIEKLNNATFEQVREKYQGLFNVKETPCDNKIYLLKRIIYKLQELEYGGLSKEAQDKIEELTKEFDPINNIALRPSIPKERVLLRDRRLPIPGTVITKEYKGNNFQVKVLEKGFEYNSKVYKSLTAVAKAVTGAHWNGYLFFNL